MTAERPHSAGDAPITMFGPDFPFAFDDYVKSPAGLGTLPAPAHGTEVAVIGAGISGIVAAHELLKLGFRPVVYEADRIGGRLRSEPVKGVEDMVVELGGMRFPPTGTTFYHYLDKAEVETVPFPNPLVPATPSTVIELAGAKHFARVLGDLPAIFHDVARAWDSAIEDGAGFAAMQRAMRERDAKAVKAIWDPLVASLDHTSFYSFLAQSDAFKSRSFRHLEIFGQVGFGTGGWDTDFPNSMLEILRVIYGNADSDHRTVVGGVEQVPNRLWRLSPDKMVHWPPGTSLSSLHNGTPAPGVTRMARDANGRIAVTDRWGTTRAFEAAIVTCQSWLLSTLIDCDERLFSQDLWMAMERTHYMQASKTFIIVDRPFWKDIDPKTGQDVMSMTLSDRKTRGTYLLDHGEGKPAAICLSYTWNDDAMKWITLPTEERVRLMIESLQKIYPGVDVRRHIIAEPISVSWEHDPNFMGAFKANLPGHYRYQRRLYGHFMQDGLPPAQRGIFLAGDSISWTAGWAEGAVTTALNAVWGVLNQFGGKTHKSNPGPGDKWAEFGPVLLPGG